MVEDIFDDVKARTQPQKPTVDQLKSDTRAFIITRLGQGYQAIRQIYAEVMGSVWRNQHGLTIRQILGDLDTKALSLMQKSQATLEYLEKIAPGSTVDLPGVPEGWTLTPELDASGQPTGRIVITEPT